MPGPLGTGYELHHFAITSDQKMGGHSQAFDGRVIRMRFGIQAIGEEFQDPRSAELVRRQTDGVNHDQVNRGARWSRIAIG